MEPVTLTTLIWADIGKFLSNMWFFVLLVIIFAASMLIGHNAIPSLVSSGNVPDSLQKLRLPIYIVALISLLAAPEGIKIVIGPVFNKNLVHLSEMEDMIFLNSR